MKILEDCFARDNEWTKETVEYIMANTKLSEVQVYKWGYDQKRKNSCKEGIRNRIREYRRRKISETATNDYNNMVSELFPEDDNHEEIKMFKTKPEMEVKKSLRAKKTRIVEKRSHTLLSKEDEKVNYSTFQPSLELFFDEKLEDAGFELKEQWNTNDWTAELGWRAEINQENYWKEAIYYEKIQEDNLSQFGVISDEHEREFDFEFGQ